MSQRRGLQLKRECLTELDAGHLLSVAGGTHIRTNCHCPPTTLSWGWTCAECPVPTLPLNECVKHVA